MISAHLHMSALCSPARRFAVLLFRRRLAQRLASTLINNAGIMLRSGCSRAGRARRAVFFGVRRGDARAHLTEE